MIENGNLVMLGRASHEDPEVRATANRAAWKILGQASLKFKTIKIKGEEYVSLTLFGKANRDNITDTEFQAVSNLANVRKDLLQGYGLLLISGVEANNLREELGLKRATLTANLSLVRPALLVLLLLATPSTAGDYLRNELGLNLMARFKDIAVGAGMLPPDLNEDGEEYRPKPRQAKLKTEDPLDCLDKILSTLMARRDELSNELLRIDDQIYSIKNAIDTMSR